MNLDITKSSRFSPIIQLSIYSENKVGRLNELFGILAANKIHLVAFTCVDSTDSSIIRIIVDYTEAACAILEENAFTYNTSEVVAVEMATEASLKSVTSGLVEAEINIYYVYPFLMRPSGRCGLILRLEDNDLAMYVLRKRQIAVLSQEDIAR